MEEQNHLVAVLLQSQDLEGLRPGLHRHLTSRDLVESLINVVNERTLEDPFTLAGFCNTHVTHSNLLYPDVQYRRI